MTGQLVSPSLGFYRYKKETVIIPPSSCEDRLRYCLVPIFLYRIWNIRLPIPPRQLKDPFGESLLSCSYT